MDTVHVYTFATIKLMKKLSIYLNNVKKDSDQFKSDIKLILLTKSTDYVYKGSKRSH